MKEKGNFFVHRPIVAMVIAIVIVIVGLVFMLGLPMEQYPNISPPMVSVSTSYTGANAINVEQSIATPLEQQVNGVDNMIYMKSTNSNDGTMNLDISFEIGTDPDMNTVFTQNRVSQATPKLPENVKQYGLTIKKKYSFPLMLVAITSTNDNYDQNFLGNYATINIKDLLSRTKGIGSVDVLGSSDYSMRLWVKPDRLAQLGITIPEIMNAVKEQNIIVPGGKFGAEPAPPGIEFTYTVRLPDRLQTEEEFGNIIVRSNPDGSQVKVKDVARVELGAESYIAYTRLNKKNCALLSIYQMPGSNAIETGENIKSIMKELSKSFPPGIDYEISLDTTLAISEGIHEIFITLLIALALVIFVVFIFIQDWRATLIPTAAIPVSLIGVFIVFPLLGFTINVLSLLGLVLAIGIVVDDAIVVVEAVQINIANGMKPKKATIEAMKLVTGPVIATTLVLVGVFIPVSVMGGITGRLFQQFAITIAVSVVFSSINALTLSPALCSLLLRESKPYKGIAGKFFKGFNNGFDRFTGSYMNLSKIIARKITRSIIFILILSGSIFILSKFIPGGFIPEEDQGYFCVNVQLPDAASLQRTNVITSKIEDVLMDIEEINFTTNVTGFSLLTGSTSTNGGFMFVSLKDWDKRERTAAQVIEEINKKLYSIKGAVAFAFGPPAIPGLGTGSGFSLMLQDKGGNSPEYLAEQAAKFAKTAQERPEIGNIFSPFQANVPQKYIDINIDKTLKAGVDLQDLYTTIGTFLGGSYINDFNRFGRLYKAYIQAEPRYRLNQDQLNLFFVKNNDGVSLPLSALVSVENISGPDYTNRYNLFRAVELTGSAAKGYSSDQALDAIEEIAKETLPADMGYEWSNMSYQEREAGGSGNIVFVFALIFVFLILAAQYESWSLPLSILLGTPFAVFGAMLFLFVARFFSETFENNIFTEISLVMLIAMAAKNAILIIEYAMNEFSKGLSLYNSAINAAKLRFRPILMTAFSFIFGVFPLVVASGAGAEPRQVMGMALLGGMTIATFLGVFMYPMLFVFIGKIAGYEKNRKLTPQVVEKENTINKNQTISHE